MPSYPYDVKFTIDPEGENKQYGFMLLTPQNATKQLVSTEAPSSTMGRGEGADVLRATYEATYDQSVAQIDWSYGMGQVELDTGEENMYSVGLGVVTHALGKAYPALGPISTLPLGTSSSLGGIRSYVDSSGNRYDFAWAGTSLYRRDPSSSANGWTSIYTAPSVITDFVIFNGLGLVAIGQSNSATNDFITLASPFGTPTATVRNHSAFTSTEKPYYWQIVRNTLYALVNPNKVFMTVDPTQDSWVGPISITVGSITAPGAGDSTFRFTSSVSLNDYLLVFKENAGYGIDSEQNVVEVIWQFASRPSRENFEWVVPAGEYCVYTAANDVWVYDPRSGANFPIGISRMHSVSVSKILGLSSDSQHVYVLAEVTSRHLGSTAYVALIRSTRVSGLRYAHELVWYTPVSSDVMHGVWVVPRNQTSNSVYLGYTSGSNTVTMLFHYPTDWDESSASGARLSGSLYTSEISSKLPTFVKRYLWLGVSAENVSATSYIDVYIRVDSGSWTYIGKVDSQYKIFTLSDVIGRVAQLRFQFVSDGSTCPVLRAYDLHARPRYRYLPIKELQIRVADNIELNNGTRDSRKMAEIFSQLRELRTSEKKILYEDFTGESFLCSIEKLNFQPSLHEVPTSNVEMVAVMTVTRSDEGA
jgi:hypothetical protein